MSRVKIKNRVRAGLQGAICRGLFIFLLFALAGQTAFAERGKRPVIIIPGVTGSQIVSPETGKTVWFSFGFSRDEPDDLRLPLSPDLRQNTDSLVAGDIIREIKLPGVLKIFPEIGVYGTALAALRAKGYTEGDWDNPQEADVYYVFPYDWRRDNVESAQRLIEKIEAVKAKLNRPDLKFNLVAHSMGGLIARYAAMYGKADLPPGGKAPVPTWAGSRHINKIMLFGTPNEGSFSAFEVLIKGYSVAGRKLPFVMDLGPDDVFSIPALYQMMPSGATAQFFNENLQPVAVDLYNPANWRKYNWGALSDPKFLGKLKDAAAIPNVKPLTWKIRNRDDKILSETTYRQAQRFLAAALARARSFQRALNVGVARSPVEILAYGSECEPTLSGIVLVHDAGKNSWRTLVAPEKLKTAAGRQISKEEMSRVMFADGDGRVTRRSFLPLAAPARIKRSPVKTIFPVKSSFFFCAEHQKLLNDENIQNTYLTGLGDEAERAAPK